MTFTGSHNHEVVDESNHLRHREARDRLFDAEIETLWKAGQKPAQIVETINVGVEGGKAVKAATVRARVQDLVRNLADLQEELRDIEGVCDVGIKSDHQKGAFAFIINNELIEEAELEVSQLVGMDATYNVGPTGVELITLTVFSELLNRYIAPIHAVVNGAEAGFYRAVLRNALGFRIDPLWVHVDRAPAEHKAIRKMLPNARIVQSINADNTSNAIR